MRALTLNVIVRTIMGMEDGAGADRLRAALLPVVNIRTRELPMWVWPQLTRIGPWRRAVEALDHADDLLYELIDRRRRDPERDQRPDMLSLLLDGDPDDELVLAELLTLLLGGFETTAVAAAWMFERLLRHPDGSPVGSRRRERSLRSLP